MGFITIIGRFSPIRRNISYGCALAAVAIFFFSAEFFIEKFIYNNDEAVDIVCAIGGAFVFYFLMPLFDRVTDKIFFRKDYDQAKALYEIGLLLDTTIDFKTFPRSVHEFLLRTVRPQKVIFLFEESSGLISFDINSRLPPDPISRKTYYKVADHCFKQAKLIFIDEEKERNSDGKIAAMARGLGIAAIIPLASKEESRAMMFVGARLSGGGFRKKDKTILASLAQQAAMVIRTARLYEEIRQHDEFFEMKVAQSADSIRTTYESRSKFLTEVSHELQTPLAILRGNVEALQGNRKQERDRTLRVIATTIADMSRLIDTVLESARLKFSKNTFYKKDVCVGILLQEICEDCSILAEDKNIHISAASDELWISADRSKLKEVVLNLVSNALKHTPGGGAIKLYAKNNEEAVYIIVEDTGSGISPDDVPHIFDRFYKIENAHGARTPSTGIGLDICRQIIEAHGGTITVESQIRKGSRFIIQLPILI